MRRLLQVLAGTLLGLLVALWLFRPGGSPAVAPGPAGYFLPSPLPAPVFTLASHRGDRVSSQDFPGRLLVVFFGYTSCPDVCPLTLTNLRRAFDALGETGNRIQVLLVSVDPQRDTPDRLGSYLAAFHPSFLGLTGTEEEVRTVANGFGAYFGRAGEGSDYTVDHTSRIFVVDARGLIPLTFPVSATPAEMARDLSRLLDDRP